MCHVSYRANVDRSLPRNNFRRQRSQSGYIQIFCIGLFWKFWSRNLSEWLQPGAFPECRLGLFKGLFFFDIVIVMTISSFKRRRPWKRVLVRGHITVGSHDRDGWPQVLRLFSVLSFCLFQLRSSCGWVRCDSAAPREEPLLKMFPSRQ